MARFLRRRQIANIPASVAPPPGRPFCLAKVSQSATTSPVFSVAVSAFSLKCWSKKASTTSVFPDLRGAFAALVRRRHTAYAPANTAPVAPAPSAIRSQSRTIPPVLSSPNFPSTSKCLAKKGVSFAVAFVCKSWNCPSVAAPDATSAASFSSGTTVSKFCAYAPLAVATKQR